MVQYILQTWCMYVIAFVLRFIKYVRLHAYNSSGPITVYELSRAQKLEIRSCQLFTFTQEIKTYKTIPPQTDAFYL